MKRKENGGMRTNDSHGAENSGRGITRRRLLAGLGIVAIGAAVGGAASVVEARADSLRPPGALEEDDFLSRCIRCERCISVCPENVLMPSGIEGGAITVRTPVVDYSDAACTFCGECQTVCPTDAIGSSDAWNPAQGRIGMAVVHPDRCLAYLQAESCGVCVDGCPYEALSFDEERRPFVVEDACNGCGVCESVCPANVLTSFGGGKSRGIEVMTMRAFEEGARE